MEALELESLVRKAEGQPPLDAAGLLVSEPAENITAVLSALPAEQALAIAGHLPFAASPASKVRGRVGDLVEPVDPVLRGDQTVSTAVDALVHHPAREEVSYFYVVDAEHKLVGVFGMRDLLLARPTQLIAEIMVKEPFAFAADMLIRDAVGPVIARHYPRYPVVDDKGALLGIVHGYRIQERIAAELSNQVGAMVGLDRDERIATPILKAFRMRHPWLQINLFTAFLAAFVVASFEDTIARVVALAAFLPVLAGQSGNTGCQAMAITLRGMTLGELIGYPKWRLLRKEIVLGALNGALVGLVAALAMAVYAGMTGAPEPATLALVILVAMVGACVGSGIFGVLVPLTLRTLGADPAMASAIFLTTITDILGMGLMLFLASTLVG